MFEENQFDNLKKNITKDFKWYEVVVSKDYPELAAKIKLTREDKLKIFYFFSTIMQPVRDKFGIVTTLSGKRSWELNEKVEGARTSDHLFRGLSCALDFTAGDMLACFEWMKAMLPHAFGQLIYYPGRNFIHVSLPTKDHHGEVMIR